jgi:hypothetical protein
VHDSIPPVFALGLGCLIGLLLHGPIERWLRTLVRTLRTRADPDSGRAARATGLLLIFATLHPAPWLLLVGLPYAGYRLWSDPLRMLWACLLTGALLGPLALIAADRCRSAVRARLLHRSRRSG